MITFIISRDYKKEDGKTYTFAEFSVDSVSELPAANEAIDGKYLVAGSIGLVIETGNIYALNSEGEWVNQTGEDTVTASSNSANSTLNASPLNIDRSALLNKTGTLDTNSTSELGDLVSGESVIETSEKDGEADVVGDTESK